MQGISHICFKFLVSAGRNWFARVAVTRSTAVRFRFLESSASSSFICLFDSLESERSSLTHARADSVEMNVPSICHDSHRLQFSCCHALMPWLHNSQFHITSRIWREWSRTANESNLVISNFDQTRKAQSVATGVPVQRVRIASDNVQTRSAAT
jgi:hypothetical protein